MFVNRVFILLAVLLVSTELGETKDYDMIAQQEAQRMFGMRAELEAAEAAQAMSRRHLLYDDDHVYSASPTENTYAPTPSGTTSFASTCLANCTSYDAQTWNLDNWCLFYWESGCYLPDVNFLGISPAGKALVSDYACVPECMAGEGGRCGASYCRTFSHLYSSCRTGYAGLNFNSTLQDATHASCLVNFLKKNFADFGMTYNSSNLTTASWIASFTLSPVTTEDIGSEESLAHASLSSAIAHLLSGVNAANVRVISIGDISVLAPTFKPTAAPTLSAAPTIATPTLNPTSSPTTNDSVICAELQQHSWCNDNQADNIYLGIADNATDCRNKCNSYIGTVFTTGCCLFYTGNREQPLFDTNGCSLQPSGSDTPWEDSKLFWMSMCSSVSALPTPTPTLAPTLDVSAGETGAPSPAPTLSTPIPTWTPTAGPTFIPSPLPTVLPTDPTNAPTPAPTSPSVGIRVVVQINSSIETLGLPAMSEVDAYLKLSGELKSAFNSRAFDESLWLASTSFGCNVTLGSTGHDLDTELYGYDHPTAAPTLAGVTPAPTPTLFWEADNSTLSNADDDETVIIASSTAAAVVGTGAIGTVMYSYATSDLVKVTADPADGIELLSV